MTAATNPALRGAKSRDIAIRARARWSGFPREVPGLSDAVAWALVARALRPGTSEVERARLLLLAARRADTRATRHLLQRLIARFDVIAQGATFRARHIGWDRYTEQDFDMRTPELTTSLVLKEPGPGGEKGVLYCSFEYNWMRILAHYDAKGLLSEYFLVGASSWSPTDYVGLANWSGISRDPLFIGISNRSDLQSYGLLAPLIEPVPLMASDWTHPGYYYPRPHVERDIDILMVANFSRFKRHWLLFEALRRMPPDLRVVLIGIAPPGRGVDVIRAEARAFGAPQELEILPGVPNSTVGSYQERAKVSLIFSRREGSCVAVAESLFAGSPVGMMHDAHVGSKAYITDQTGVLLRRRGLSRALSEFIERSGTFNTRAWAEANISCFRSSHLLNAQLRAYSQRAGLPWTRDIVPMCWRHFPTYATDEGEQELVGAPERLRREHGVSMRWVPVRRPTSEPTSAEA